MSVFVVPTPLVTNPPIIYGFKYTVQSFQLNTQVTFNVILMDQNGTPLSVSQVSLSGDDYKAWGQNDSYVENYICSSLGLTLLPPPQILEPVVAEPEVVVAEPELVVTEPETVVAEVEPVVSDV
jgi:hypothetical protein